MIRLIRAIARKWGADREAYQRGYMLAYTEVSDWLKDKDLGLEGLKTLIKASEHTAKWSKDSSAFYRGKYTAIQEIKKLMDFMLGL